LYLKCIFEDRDRNNRWAKKLRERDCPKRGTNSTVSGSAYCQLCAVGTYSAAEASTCLTCLDGTYSPRNASTLCATCTQEQPFSQPDRSECSAFCPPGFQVSLPNTCALCTPGTFSKTYSNNTVCSLCPEGMFSEKTNGSTACSSCGPGTYQVESVSCSSLGQCGRFCAECAAGTYSVGGKASCTICSGGTISEEGASACSACTPAESRNCSYCDPGFFPNLVDAINQGCTACMPGKYLSLYRGTVCTACPAGQFSSVTNATACQACTARCTGSNFYRISKCSDDYDLDCRRFQSALSFEFKVAMFTVPYLILLCIFFVICSVQADCVPSKLRPLKIKDMSQLWKTVLNDPLFEPNSCKSLNAALFTLSFAFMDLVSNIQLIILLSPGAPYSIFAVQCGSIGTTLLVDMLFCWFKPGAPSSRNPGLSLLWLYMLECQELDPAWQHSSRAKYCKIVRFFTNTLPSYYVQVCPSELRIYLALPQANATLPPCIIKWSPLADL
jgi:hypothetical protein